MSKCLALLDFRVTSPPKLLFLRSLPDEETRVLPAPAPVGTGLAAAARHMGHGAEPARAGEITLHLRRVLAGLGSAPLALFIGGNIKLARTVTRLPLPILTGGWVFRELVAPTDRARACTGPRPRRESRTGRRLAQDHLTPPTRIRAWSEALAGCWSSRATVASSGMAYREGCAEPAQSGASQH